MSNLKRRVNSSSNFASFFIVMTSNSPVNFKLTHFLLWIKESHQSPTLETFKCSVENVPNASCHFWKQRSVFLQILHQYSVPSNISPNFSPNIIYFGQRQPIKKQNFEIFKCSDQNSSNALCQYWTDQSLPLECLHHSSLTLHLPSSSCYFTNHKLIFLQILHYSLVAWKITPLYFFRSNINGKDQSKCKYLRLLSARIKIHQILMIFKTISFPSNFLSIFSAIKHNSSVLSNLKHYILWSKAVR